MRKHHHALIALYAATIIAGSLAFADAAAAQTAPADPVPNAQPDDAPETSGPSVTFNAGLASDYVFRGVSQTDENPQVFAGVDFSSGHVYAGAWASNVEFPGDPDTNAEIDLYAGFKPVVGHVNFDLGVIAYLYTGQPNDADYDYVEAKIAASTAAGAGTVGGAVYFSPDFFGASEHEATYVEVNGSYPLTDRFSVSGALGRQFVSSDFDYTTANVGVAFAATDRITLDLRAHLNDEEDFGAIYENRVVISAKAVF